MSPVMCASFPLVQVGNQDVQLTMKPIPKHLGPLSPAGAILSSIIRLRVSAVLSLPGLYPQNCINLSMAGPGST